MSKTKEYPACRNCGNAMVWSFAFSGCEYVCLPCDEGEPMWNSRPKLERQVSSMEAKKRKWQEELTILGRRVGGGTCAVCKDHSCKWCKLSDNKDYKFKIWKSRVFEDNTNV